MLHIKNILTGWAKRYGLLPVEEAEQKLSELRLSICEKCPFGKVSKVLEFISDDNAEYVDTLYCNGGCSCPCKQKSLVVSESCPQNFW